VCVCVCVVLTTLRSLFLSLDCATPQQAIARGSVVGNLGRHTPLQSVRALILTATLALLILTPGA
jgi:hypothetical protein